ncbi:unnamed protein product [Euphydryas editha]|uniref:Uncharacterized protein n=1 Tax=Euphydryas editha TaxID=104508 RepID=A0AAU9UKQ5_EUPED|nr:unnamed protein product [Euphydryas editha]
MSNKDLPGPSGLGGAAKFSSPKKKRAKKSAMSSLEKTVLINIYKLVNETWPENEFIYRKDIAKKTAETAGVSLSTVYKVLKEYTNEKRVRSPIPAPKRLTKVKQLDEIDLRHTKSKVWQDLSIQSTREARREGLSTGLKAPSGKGKRLIILHIGSEDGFLNGGELIFASKKGEGDYHQEMNAKMFEEWFSKILKKLSPIL